MNRLQEKYNKEIKPKLKEEFGIKNNLATPKVVKVVVNMGIGEAAKNQSQTDSLKKDIAQITGQMPSVRRARVSIAGFGLRAGMPVGVSVTLRGERMYSFLDRLFSITLPRLRDFRGVPLKSFDSSGNYTIGFVEHTVFPEVDNTKSANPHGMEVTIVTNTENTKGFAKDVGSSTDAVGSSTDAVVKSRRLLELLGCPFEKS